MNTVILKEPELRKPGVYLCQVCETRFTFMSGETICPKCGARNRDNLVAIYVEDDPLVEQLRSDDHWHAGD